VENIILVPTRNRAAGPAILRALDDLDAASAIELRAAALVERLVDGRWYLPDETQNVWYRGTLTDGAIGSLMGLLGGPAGLLLGGAGLLVGSPAEIGAAERPETLVHALGRLVPPGTMAAVGEVCETTSTATDHALAGLGLSGWRMPRAEAEAQLHAALGYDGMPPAPQHRSGSSG